MACLGGLERSVMGGRQPGRGADAVRRAVSGAEAQVLRAALDEPDAGDRAAGGS
jgi:hypothetical protein